MLAKRDAEELLLRGGVDTAPLVLEVLKDENPPNNTSADFMLSLTWKGTRKNFIAEYKSVSTPRNVETAIGLVKSYCKLVPDYLPMVMFPFISGKTARRLVEADVSGLDFSGNMVLVIPDEWLVIKTGSLNQFPSNQPIKNVYQGKSSLVGRIVLTCGVFPTVKSVREEILKRGGTVSWGTVSKVLSTLQDDLLITKNAGVRLLQPASLLDQLAGTYQRPGATRRRRGKSANIQLLFDEVLRRTATSGIRVIGRSEQLYAIAPSTDDIITIYVSRLGEWIDELPFEETDRFYNIEFVEVADEVVFFDSTEWQGFPWCSKLQVYLELMQGGKRELEIADQVRADLIGPGSNEPPGEALHAE